LGNFLLAKFSLGHFFSAKYFCEFPKDVHLCHTRVAELGKSSFHRTFIVRVVLPLHFPKWQSAAAGSWRTALYSKTTTAAKTHKHPPSCAPNGSFSGGKLTLYR
jgi:hypothetical protein